MKNQEKKEKKSEKCVNCNVGEFPKCESKDCCCEYKYKYKKKGFNFGGFFLGLVLVGVGIFYLMRNFGWLPANASISLFQLWPIIIIFIGLSFLSARNWFIGIIGFVVTLIVLAVTVLTIAKSVSFDSNVNNTPINIPKSESANTINLEIKNVFGSLKISDGDNEGIRGGLNSNISELGLQVTEENGLQNVLVDSVWNQAWRSKLWKEKITNKLSFSLNRNTPTQIYVEGGAADMDLNFENIETSLIGIDAGATKLNLALGNKMDNQTVEINAGASDIKIFAPIESGVKIEVKSGAVTKEIVGLKKISDNLYQSENYDSAGKKIDINLNLGASSLEFAFK